MQNTNIIKCISHDVDEMMVYINKIISKYEQFEEFIYKCFYFYCKNTNNL